MPVCVSPETTAIAAALVALVVFFVNPTRTTAYLAVGTYLFAMVFT